MAYSTLTKSLGTLLALLSSAAVSSAQLVNQGGTITIQAGATLVVETPDGSIDWPPQVPYGTAADDISVRTTAEELIGVGIVIPPMTMTCVPGPQGLTYHSGEESPSVEAIPAFIKFVRRGAETFVPVELLLEVRNTAPVPAVGEFREIETEIVSMSCVMPQGGHPYFTSVSLVARPGGGGSTSLRSAAAGGFYVNSAFDAFFDITAVGAPGEPFDGVSISTSKSAELRCVLDAFDGVGFEPMGDASVMEIDGCLQVDNLGSSGLDGVRIASKGTGHGIGSSGYDLYGRGTGHGIGSSGYDLYISGRGHGIGSSGYDLYSSISASIPGNSSANGFLGDGQSLAAYPFPPPPLPDFPDLPALSVVCTNDGGTVSGVCSSNSVRASEWVVEVWEGDVLKAVGTAADESACWSIPATGFRPVEIHCGGTTKRGNLAISTEITLQQPSEISLSGNATPVVGDRVKMSPRDPKVLPGGVSELVLLTSADSLCIESVQFREHELDHMGLGNAVITPLTRGLLVDNIGSSGEDGIAACDDDNDMLPYRAELRPLDIEGPGGTFWLSSLDAEGNNVATAEYRGGGGAGGKILVDYNTASTVCRVTVMNDGEYVGEFDVPLAPDGQTEVCAIGGSPRLTACGKLRLEWPWELSCLVEEFDQPVMITPTGGKGLVGNEVRLLAPGATAAEVESISMIQMRAAGVPEFEVCGESNGLDVDGPLLPPTPSADWEFPGAGTELVMAKDVYYTWDEASGTAVCVSKKIRDHVLVSQQGRRRTYSATMDVHLEGVGGLVLSKDLELPGTFTVGIGDNAFLGEDVQQYEVRVREFSFALPQGADPEINRLSISLGDGFDSSGDVIISKIPECELEIQALLDILAGFELSGSFGGGGDIDFVGHELVHPKQVSRPAGGLAHMTIGQADVSTTANNGLIVSNIGSSGEDGVSIQLPGVESLEVDLAPVDLQPGGSLSFEPRGQLKGGSVGVGLGRCVVTRAPAGEESYAIALDVAGLSPSATSIEIYDAGALVASYPSGLDVISLSAGGVGKVDACGKLSGRSSTPCDVVCFDEQMAFRVEGQPGATGDEVRLLVHGLEVDVLSSFQMHFARCGDVEILEEKMGLAGREIVGTRGALATDYNSSRSNKRGIVFDPDPDDDNDDDDDNDGVLEMRAPESAILNGRRQLWPMTCHLDPHYVSFDALGSSLKFEAHGTIDGDAEAAYGGLELVYNGSVFELRGDFAGRGTNSALVVARGRKRIDQTTPLLAMVVPTGGEITSATIRPTDGGANLPIVEVSAVPELGEPPFEEIECSYRLRFSEAVEITIGDSEPFLGHEIEVRLENPTFVSEDIYCIKMSGEGVKPIVVTGIATGPFYGQGLSHSTGGGAQIEEADPGNRGSLVVSNIGSSGEDTISIELDLGEGFWQKIAPVDLTVPGRSLRAGLANDVIDEDCDLVILGDGGPLDDDCDLIAAELVGGGGGMMELILRTTRPGGNGALVGTTGGTGGTQTGFGETEPGIAGINGSGANVIGYGVLPATVIPGVGYVGESVAFEFDQPIVCNAIGGGSIVCDTLRICPDMRQLPRDSSIGRFGQLAIANVAELEITETTLLHLDKQEHEALGVAKMVALDGELLLDNIGSSGQDGVRVPTSKIHNKMVQVMMAISAPRPDGEGTLTCAPHGFLEGDPDRPLGESTIGLSAASNRMPISADFSALSAANVQVFVCDNRDNDCDDDQIVAPNGDVCEVHLDSVLPAKLVGVGYVGERPIPGGGTRPAGIVWEFDQPVEVTEPGADPGTGTFGKVVLLVPSGDQTKDGHPDWIHLTSAGLAGFSLLDSPEDGGISAMDDWLIANFTPDEIDQLDAADYALDIDEDGYDEIEEFVIGLDPKKRDDRSHKPVMTMDVRDDDAFARMSYEFDPDRQGVRHDLEISADLSSWVDMIVAPDMWRLVEDEELSTGNRRQTWERTDPIGAHANEYYRHRGHVTVLK